MQLHVHVCFTFTSTEVDEANWFEQLLSKTKIVLYSNAILGVVTYIGVIGALRENKMEDDNKYTLKKAMTVAICLSMNASANRCE